MKNLLYLLIIPFLFSCEEIFEDDLSGLNLSVATPVDNYTSNSNSVTFTFEELNDAIDYRLVIVTPDYDNIESFVVDSLIVDSPFTINLNSGEYEWELYAQNNSSESNRVRRKLFVQQGSSLDGTSLVLTSPVNNYITNEEETIFHWQSVSDTVNYNLQFFENLNGATGNTIGDLYSTTSDSILISVPEGNLIWRMNVSNWNSQSQFVERFIIIDRTAPENPEIVSPLAGTFSTSDAPAFSWNFGADNLTNTYDSLLIFTSDLSEEIYGIETTNSSETVDFSTFELGDYQWQIKTYDEAGNNSASEYGTFSIE